MNRDKSLDKFLGSVVGAAVADAVGAPMEFWDAERYARIYGGDWVDDMYDYRDKDAHHLWVWRTDSPKGTGTDDTRLNQVLVEAILKYGVDISAHLLAVEIVDRYIRRDEIYPGYLDFATRQFAYAYIRACAQLGIECPLTPGVPPYVIRSGAAGSGYPKAFGLYSIQAAGLLHPGDGEATYKHAFELDYHDFGFARDAFAILATMIGLAFDESLSPREVIREALEIDPYELSSERWPRAMVSWVNQCLDIADAAKDERDLVNSISRKVAGEPAFGSKDLLGFAAAAAYFAEGDPRRAILIAVNARDLDDSGNLVKFRDIDCTGSATGALVGAMSGLSSFPDEWVSACLAANLEVYGFDLEANATALHKLVMGR